MSVLSAKERGDMAEALLPVAAHLAALVHGDGGPEDVRDVLAGLDDAQRTALIVVLAGLVDPDQPMGNALGWLDFNEHGQTVVPAWGSHRTVRDLAPEPELEDEETYTDYAAVQDYLDGKPVNVTPRERLKAVVKGVNRGMKYPEFDRMHGLREGSTSTFISRTRRAFAERGEAFPAMARPDAGTPVLTDEQVVEIRERYAAGNTTDMELAMSYGVVRNTITNLLNGKSYQHAGGPIRPKRATSQPKLSSRVLFARCEEGFYRDNSETKEVAA